MPRFGTQQARGPASATDKPHQTVAQREMGEWWRQFRAEDPPGAIWRRIAGLLHGVLRWIRTDAGVKLNREPERLAGVLTVKTSSANFGVPGIALDGHGNLYLAELDDNLIYKYSLTGRELAHWGEHGSGPGQDLSRDSPNSVFDDHSDSRET